MLLQPRGDSGTKATPSADQPTSPTASSSASWPTSTADPWDNSDDEAPMPGQLTVGSHAATVPSGWDVVRNEANEVVLTRGANRVDAYAFVADSQDRAIDLVVPLTRSRRAGFRGQLRVTDHDQDPVYGQYAWIESHGTFGGKAAKLWSMLWLEPELGDAFLVIEIVTALSGSKTAVQADALFRDLTMDLP
ncbi:MAG: hypothetical protein QM779_06995 [Propionicimonas sp.]|uniref:hypothetical protein n=1 Tax=Propionicimonas sp. TaxID=1955623 RepID=UPI003D09A445